MYKHPCIILLTDFEKAIDTVRWSFIKNAIKVLWF